MAVQDRLYTADEFWEVFGERKGYELVEGRVVHMSPTGPKHGILVNEIACLVTGFVRAGDVGYVFSAETGFLLSKNPDVIRAPDVAFISKDQINIQTESYLDFAPDLVVEVRIPANNEGVIHEKAVEYFRAGTRLVWAFYPKSRAVYVYHAPTKITVLGVDDTLEGGDVLPGFKVNVKDVFAVLDK